eukprot:GHVR01030496.1.p1 GENE.GHVR01030496.1~~GHVR01030496.1.p1  ORF type:complete len:182 (+),score=51.27 GHVR01030496.1:2-547(+)
MIVSVIPYYRGKMAKDYIMDDTVAIIKNNDIISNYTEFKYINLLRHDFWGSDLYNGTWTHKSYRPITTYTYRLNYIIHGFNSYGFHFINTLLHFIVSIFLGIFIGYKILNLSYIYSCILLLIFVTHPIHTENVHYLVGRADILAALFANISLYIYIIFVINYNKIIDNKILNNNTSTHTHT